MIVNHDHLMFRYEILDMLGKGSFGQVAKCYDHKTGEYVAIKIIRNKMRFHCQAVVEVKILGCLNKWVIREGQGSFRSKYSPLIFVIIQNSHHVDDTNEKRH